MTSESVLDQDGKKDRWSVCCPWFRVEPKSPTQDGRLVSIHNMWFLRRHGQVSECTCLFIGLLPICISSRSTKPTKQLLDFRFNLLTLVPPYPYSVHPPRSPLLETSRTVFRTVSCGVFSS